MPNTPGTPRKSFRIPPALFEAAKKKATERGETLTDVVIRAFQRYINGEKS